MKTSFVTIALTALLLSACGPSFEEKGFASGEEAERLSALGFPTFTALMERGRFQDAEQAREAVAKGFYNLDDYETSLYEEYQSDSYSLEDVLGLAAEFSKVSLGDRLLAEKLNALYIKYPTSREWDPAKAMVVVTATATPEVCDLLKRGLDQIKDEKIRPSYVQMNDYTCEGVSSVAERGTLQEKEKPLSPESPRTVLVYNFRCTGVYYAGYTGDLKIDTGTKTATWMKMDFKENFRETDSSWSASGPLSQVLLFDKRTDLLTITDKFDRATEYQC